MQYYCLVYFFCTHIISALKHATADVTQNSYTYLKKLVKDIKITFKNFLWLSFFLSSYTIFIVVLSLEGLLVIREQVKPAVSVINYIMCRRMNRLTGSFPPQAQLLKE